MRPDFGSRLHEFTFANIDAAAQSLISHYVTDALVEWEPRIDVLDVEVSVEEAAQGKLLIDIEYKIMATNSIFHLVYPFYLAEGKEASP